MKIPYWIAIILVIASLIGYGYIRCPSDVKAKTEIHKKI